LTRLKRQPQLSQKCLFLARSRVIAPAGFDHLHDVSTRLAPGDGIDVDVKMWNEKSEFENYGTITLERLEERKLEATIASDEMESFVLRQVRDVLDVSPPHEHRVTWRCPVLVQYREGALVAGDDSIVLGLGERA